MQNITTKITSIANLNSELQQCTPELQTYVEQLKEDSRQLLRFYESFNALNATFLISQASMLYLSHHLISGGVTTETKGENMAMIYGEINMLMQYGGERYSDPAMNVLI